MKKYVFLLVFLIPSIAIGAALLPPSPQFCAYDTDGEPYAGGKLYAYETGTTTLYDTYSDATGGTTNTNPVILNSRGCANVWLDGNQSYRLKLDTSADVTVFTVDSVKGDQTDPFIPNPSTGDDRDTLAVDGSAWQLIPGLPTPVGETPGDPVVVNATSTGFEVSSIDTVPDPSGGSAGQVIAVNSGTTAYELVTPTPAGMQINGVIGGDASHTAADTANDLTFQAFRCMDSTGTVVINTTAATTKRLDADYADDTGNGGMLNDATKTASTIYLWVAMGDGVADDGQIGYLDIADIATIATEVSTEGYDYYKVIGYGRTNTSNSWVGFTQNGAYIQYWNADENYFADGVEATGFDTVVQTDLLAEDYTELIEYGVRDATENSNVLASEDGTNVSFFVGKATVLDSTTTIDTWGENGFSAGLRPYNTDREFNGGNGTVDLLVRQIKFKR